MKHLEKSKKWQHRGLLGAVMLAFGLAWDEAAAQIPPGTTLTPTVVDGFIDYGRRQGTIFFGYTMESDLSQITVDVGPLNFFSPGPPRRNQPTTFFRNHQGAAFSTTFDITSIPILTWTLQGTPAAGDPKDFRTFVQWDDPYNPAWASQWITIRGGTLRVESASMNVTDLVIESAGQIRFLNGTSSSVTDPVQNAGRMELMGGSLNASITNLGTVTVETGSTLESSNFLNQNQLLLQGGTAQVTALDNRALVSVGAGSLLQVMQPFTLTATSVLRLDGGRVELETLTNQGGTLDLRSGTLRVAQGDLVAAAGGMLGLNPVLLGTRLELGSGRTEVQTGRSLSIFNGAELVTNGGTNAGNLTVFNSRFTSTANVTNEAGGQFQVVFGEVETAGFHNAGTLNLTMSEVRGPFFSEAGSSVRVTGLADFYGIVVGPGNFTGSGEVVFHELYRAGIGPNAVSFDGSVRFEDFNFVVMDIGGLILGTEYDSLRVGSNLTLGGSLILSLWDGFRPQAGDWFQLFDVAGTLSGGFGSMLGPALDDGLSWDFSQVSTAGVVSVIPEPSTILLLLVSLAGLCCFRRIKSTPQVRAAAAVLRQPEPGAG